MCAGVRARKYSALFENYSALFVRKAPTFARKAPRKFPKAPRKFQKSPPIFVKYRLLREKRHGTDLEGCFYTIHADYPKTFCTFASLNQHDGTAQVYSRLASQDPPLSRLRHPVALGLLAGALCPQRALAVLPVCDAGEGGRLAAAQDGTPLLPTGQLATAGGDRERRLSGVSGGWL